MASRIEGGAQRRGDALSRERIVSTAVDLLDASGESGLTFRALAAELATGPGAIYWHVANKDELVAAAADSVLSAALLLEADERAPASAVRAVCLRLFDAIDEHPWVAPQLTRNPWRTVMLRTVERIGQQLQALRVQEDAWFSVASALVGYTLGVGAQNAANAGAALEGRSGYLDDVASGWERLDPAEYPFMHAIAPQMRRHEDREQFAAGVDFIVAGAPRTR